MSKNRIDKSIDEIDIKIIDLMILNKNNKQISQELIIPLSTVQRRVRNATQVRRMDQCNLYKNL